MYTFLYKVMVASTLGDHVEVLKATTVVTINITRWSRYILESRRVLASLAVLSYQDHLPMILYFNF